MIGAAIIDRMDGEDPRPGDRRAIALRPGALSTRRTSPSRPAWEQVLPRANVVTVRYTGDQSESVTVERRGLDRDLRRAARRRSTRPSPTSPTRRRERRRRSRAAPSLTGTFPRRRSSAASSWRSARRSSSPRCRPRRRLDRGRRSSRDGARRSPATTGRYSRALRPARLRADAPLEVVPAEYAWNEIDPLAWPTR